MAVVRRGDSAVLCFTPGSTEHRLVAFPPNALSSYRLPLSHVGRPGLLSFFYFFIFLIAFKTSSVGCFFNHIQNVKRLLFFFSRLENMK